MTDLGHGFRFTGLFTAETEHAPRPALAYDPATSTLEFTAGRDQLPTGINVPDLSFFICSRNRFGYYDAPTQANAFFWGNRYLISPYAYGPGGTRREAIGNTSMLCGLTWRPGYEVRSQ